MGRRRGKGISYRAGVRAGGGGDEVRQHSLVLVSIYAGRVIGVIGRGAGRRLGEKKRIGGCVQTTVELPRTCGQPHAGSSRAHRMNTLRAAGQSHARPRTGHGQGGPSPHPHTHRPNMNGPGKGKKGAERAETARRHFNKCL